MGQVPKHSLTLEWAGTSSSVACIQNQENPSPHVNSNDLIGCHFRWFYYLLCHENSKPFDLPTGKILVILVEPSEVNKEIFGQIVSFTKVKYTFIIIIIIIIIIKYAAH